MNEEQEKTKNLIGELKTFAYEEGEFELSSGKRSDYYINVKRAVYLPLIGKIIGELILNVLKPFNIHYVGGLETGANGITISTVLESYNYNNKHNIITNPLFGFSVRKEENRKIKTIEPFDKWLDIPFFAKEWNVAVIDDVVTTGGSILTAIERVQEAGLKVKVVVGVVDRLEGGREAIEKTGIPFISLCTINDIRNLK